MHDEEPLMASNIFTKEIESHTWIYESPDSGKTIYKRLMGSPNKFPYKDEVEHGLKDKLGVDIIKKVSKVIGE